jgi:beta-carotene ketolase (CrtW type)
MSKHIGLYFAIIILLTWIAILIYFLQCDLKARPWLIVPGVLSLTFLYTGIFITAHDAIHGAILPGRHKLNAAIGAFCLFIYALFPYRKVRSKHFDHHRYPGSPKDPDYHNGVRTGFWAWYLHFLPGYITWWQILGMAVIFNILHHFLHIPVTNLLLFWVAPSLLSTLQLFYFGTYLPHREPKGGYDNRHHAKSNDYSTFWSFLSCYHFGYHWEHHEYPGTPWWRLPEKRQN